MTFRWCTRCCGCMTPRTDCRSLKALNRFSRNAAWSFTRRAFPPTGRFCMSAFPCAGPISARRNFAMPFLLLNPGTICSAKKATPWEMTPMKSVPRPPSFFPVFQKKQITESLRRLPHALFARVLREPFAAHPFDPPGSGGAFLIGRSSLPNLFTLHFSFLLN